MEERRSDSLAWRIPTIGWRSYEEVSLALSEFRKISSDHLFEMTPSEYATAMEKNIQDYELKPLAGYCSSYGTQQVQKDMCLLTVDIQRINMGFDVVVGLKYSLGKKEVTLLGTAMRLKEASV